MIEFTETHLRLSPLVAKAVLQFAGQDATRPHIGVGIDQGELCATDGHAAIRMIHRTVHPTSVNPSTKNGIVWGYAYVKEQARIAGPKGIVRLEWFAKEPVGFPPISQVEPAKHELLRSSCFAGWFTPYYLGLLSAVAKACSPDMSAKAGLKTQPVALTSL